LAAKNQNAVIPAASAAEGPRRTAMKSCT